MNEIEAVLTDYIVREILLGDARGLGPETRLVGGGILDSLAALMLVEFIETRWGIRLAAHETDAEHMATVASLARLISQKLARR